MARGKKATGKVDDPVGDAFREKVGAAEVVRVTQTFSKRQIPASYVFELRGKNSGTVLHDGITTKCSKNLLEGSSIKYPDLLEVGRARRRSSTD